jgi:hypothetical protein
MLNPYRADILFSFWIVIWYLLFIYKYIQYSPKVALIFGIIHNIFLLIFMIIYKNNIFNIIQFCIVNTFIKIIPLWTLRNNKRYDVIATIIIFSIYLFWLYLNNINLYDIYITQLENIKNNKEVGPVTKFFNKIFNKNI